MLKSRDNPEHTMAGRLIAACASVLFSIPLAFLFWLLFNAWLINTNGHIAAWPYVLVVALIAGISFVRPNLGTDVLGWLINAFFKLGW